MEKEKIKTNKKDKKESFFDSIFSIFLTVLITILFINFVAQFATVHGQSMAKTLDDSDIVLMEKLTKNFGTFKRFDVIIFKTTVPSHPYYIKRIIALPGETVYINQSGKIFINGEELVENYGLETIKDPGIANIPITLKENEFFVLGDNRNNSYDSRVEHVGTVKRNIIMGKVFISVKPFKSVNKEQR